MVVLLSDLIEFSNWIPKDLQTLEFVDIVIVQMKMTTNSIL